jgi:hypothetical protein
VEQIARTEYPQTQLPQQVSGVGPWIALTFLLTLEDGDRFEKSRDILSRRGRDTDLQRWGLRLAVLLHRLWVTGKVYEALRNSAAQKAVA